MYFLEKEYCVRDIVDAFREHEHENRTSNRQEFENLFGESNLNYCENIFYENEEA